MRTLVVAQDFPWPPTSGSFLRLDAVLRALGGLGPVDLFSTVLDRRDVPVQVPAGALIERSGIGLYPRPDFSALQRARWLTGRLPLELASQQFAGPRRAFTSFVRSSYDFVWFSKANTYLGLGAPELGPTVVDLDDLEDRKILARIQGGAIGGDYPTTLQGSLHRSLATAQAQVNMRRWASTQRRIAGQVRSVVVCSQLDVERLGLDNSHIVANGYDVPDDPVGRTAVRVPPSIIFQGVLHYAPNADAARWLATAIAPRIRELIPSCRVRLVGSADTPIERLDDPPRVEVVGRVPDMRSELRLADLAVVPVRFGSGTRVKVLEAFAHRIPVVSTTLGAEGLGAVDGLHLLTADDADGFARACARLLTDVALRARLTAAAHDLVVDRHQWSGAMASVVELARTVGGSQ